MLVMSMPSEVQAARASRSSHPRNAASAQALATTRAPRAGVRASIASIWRLICPAVSTPFSISSSPTAGSRAGQRFSSACSIGAWSSQSWS